MVTFDVVKFSRPVNVLVAYLERTTFTSVEPWLNSRAQ